MSYEKKLKELLGRLVAMSPEPPPYPEEITMAAQPKTRKRPHPALVFAGAVAMVAALAVPVVLLTGGGDPAAIGTTTTTTLPPGSTTVPQSTTTVPQTTTIGSVSKTGIVYLYQSPENSLSGNPALVPVLITVNGPFGDDPEGLAGAMTLALQRGGEIATSLETAIPSDVFLLSSLPGEDGVRVADMSETFLDGAGGYLADVTMLNQLIYTLTFSDPESEVLFTANGEAVDAYGSEGLVLTDPVGRDDFIDELNLIFLTEPILDDGGVYRVTGMANVFEATVNIAVLDADGAVIYEDFVTATCGTGCWGEFSAEISGDLIVPGESSIRVFTYSARDGSISDAVTVPISAGPTWVLP